jgi:PKD repeat protein
MERQGMRSARWRVVGTLAVLVLAGSFPALAGAGVFGSAAPAKVAPAVASARALPATSFPTPIHHVFVMYLENENGSSVLSQGPFEKYLSEKYAFATHYYAACHPSAPNYLTSTSGWPFQCGSDNYHAYSSGNIFAEAQSANLSWGDFSESMPTACDTQDHFNPGLYVAHHNPAVFYDNIVNNATLCDSHDQNFSAWYADVNSSSIPNFAFFAPNMNDDGHQTGIAFADKWLKSFLSPYLNATWFSSSVWFVTWDESTPGDGSGYSTPAYNPHGGYVYMAAVSPYAHSGNSLTTDASHFNLLTTEQWLLGITGTTGQPGDNVTAFPPMTSLFDFNQSALNVTILSNVTSGLAPLTVNFTSSVAGGTGPYAYSWDFGDHGTSTLPDPTHTFASPGGYTVSLTVRDSANATVTRTVSILATSTNPGVVSVSVVANETRGAVPFTPTFSAKPTGGYAPYNVSWDFGDGSAAAYGLNVTHTFATAGNFTVTATAKDYRGMTNSSHVVVEAYGTFTVAIHPSATTVSPGEIVYANATVTPAGTSGVTYKWTWNGTVIPGTGPAFRYQTSAAGTYTLAVVATDANGNKATGSVTITVGAAPPGGSGPGGSGGLPIWIWAIPVVIVVGGAAAWIWYRQRAMPVRGPVAPPPRGPVPGSPP